MDLYYLPASTPCRSVLMTAAALGIKPNKILVNTWAGEHLTPEYLKLNPQHTIPTLVDDGFSLWESRAIMIYLVEKYGKDDSLYPKCPKKQAVINQRLYFDMDPLCTSFVNFYFPQFRDQLPADPELLKKVHNALEFLNTFLEGNQYVAGDSMTIADFAFLATVSTFDGINFDFSKFKNIIRWYNHCKTIAPGWEENLEGCVAFKNMYIK